MKGTSAAIQPQSACWANQLRQAPKVQLHVRGAMACGGKGGGAWRSRGGFRGKAQRANHLPADSPLLNRDGTGVVLRQLRLLPRTVLPLASALRVQVCARKSPRLYISPGHRGNYLAWTSSRL